MNFSFLLAVWCDSLVMSFQLALAEPFILGAKVCIFVGESLNAAVKKRLDKYDTQKR